VKTNFDRRVKGILVKKGQLTEQQAEQAAAACVQEGKSFIDILIGKGFIEEKRLIAWIALEMNIPPIDLDRVKAQDKAVQSLTQDLANHYCVLPIARIGNILTLAVHNPFDILKLDDIRMVTECDIRPVVSTEPTIRKSISRAYNQDDKKMEELMEQVADPGLELMSDSDEEEVEDISKLQDDAGDSPVIKLVNMLVAQAMRLKASDIHIEPYEKKIKIRYRMDGVLREQTSPPKKMANAIVSRIKIMSQLDIAERRVPQDGKFKTIYEGRQVDFRVSILPTIHGEKVVMRILDSQSLALDIGGLGFEEKCLKDLRFCLAQPWGMMLVTGPTGSGKSTTLYSCIKEVISSEENIVTVEDPVEYQMDGVIQVPVSVKRGMTFAAALRSILRQDPDTIMIGEIRDFETADIAVKAAITGHFVMSTLHTNDAPSSISRLVDMGIDPFMVASSLLLICAQRLGRKLCEGCKQEMNPRPDDAALLREGFTSESLTPDLRIFSPIGCGRCSNGYKGRFALLETLLLDNEIKRMVINGAAAIDIRDYAVNKAGMVNLRRAGINNVIRGRTSLEEVLRNTVGDSAV